MSEELTRLTIAEMHGKLRRREVSAVELLEAHEDRIDKVDGGVKAFLRRTSNLARKQAEEADHRLVAGSGLHPLTGIPMAIKDVFCTEGVETTAGSRILSGFISPYDATVIARLRHEGVGCRLCPRRIYRGHDTATRQRLRQRLGGLQAPRPRL